MKPAQVIVMLLACLALAQAQADPTEVLQQVAALTQTIQETVANTTKIIQETIANTTEDIVADLKAMLSDAECSRIQMAQRTWNAEIPAMFKNKTIAELQQMVSVLPPNQTAADNAGRNLRATHWGSQFSEVDEDDNIPVTASIPTSFDSRTKWSGCVGAVRNQGSCGACWSFATVEAFEDRLCVAGKTKPLVQRSTQYLLDCDTTQSGCNGGNPNNAWSFLVKYGSPSESCYAYQGRKGSCPSRCTNGGALSVSKATRVVTYSSINSVKTDIMTYGPVETWMAVYQDFYYYKSGVYQQTSNSFIGYHAVKIIGWGNDSYYGNYWIVQNSWGTSWGEKGFFRIKAGSVQIDTLNHFVAGYV